MAALRGLCNYCKLSSTIASDWERGSVNRVTSVLFTVKNPGKNIPGHDIEWFICCVSHTKNKMLCCTNSPKEKMNHIVTKKK